MVNTYRGLAPGPGWRLCMHALFSPHEDPKLGNSSQQAARVLYCLLPASILSLLRDWLPVSRLAGGPARTKWLPAQIGPFPPPRALTTDQALYELKAKEQTDKPSHRFIPQAKKVRTLATLGPPCGLSAHFLATVLQWLFPGAEWWPRADHEHLEDVPLLSWERADSPKAPLTGSKRGPEKPPSHRDKPAMPGTRKVSTQKQITNSRKGKFPSSHYPQASPVSREGRNRYSHSQEKWGTETLRNLPKLWTESAKSRENKTALLAPGCALNAASACRGTPLLSLWWNFKIPFPFLCLAFFVLQRQGFSLPSYTSRPPPLLITLHKRHHLLFLSPSKKNQAGFGSWNYAEMSSGHQGSGIPPQSKPRAGEVGRRTWVWLLGKSLHRPWAWSQC